MLTPLFFISEDKVQQLQHLVAGSANGGAHYSIAMFRCSNSALAILPRVPQMVPPVTQGVVLAMVLVQRRINNQKLLWPSKTRRHLSLSSWVTCFGRPEVGVRWHVSDEKVHIIMFIHFISAA